MSRKSNNKISSDSYSIEKKINIPYLTIPDDWDYVKTEGFGPFTTKAVLKNPKGELIFGIQDFTVSITKNSI